MDAAIAAGQKYITVVVQDGTYTGGLNIDNSGNAESIVVNIVAHDAYEHNEGDGTITAPAADGEQTDGSETTESGEEAPNAVYPVPTVTNSNGKTVIDNAAINTDSAGGVKLEGGVSVKNVELLLAGIYLSLKEQQENKEAADAAAGEESNQNIKVENADSFTYYGTSKDDTVNISMTDVKNATINSGNGDDTLDINTTMSPNVQLDTSKDENVLAGEFSTASSVNTNINVSSGSGNDKITVNQNSAVTSKEGETKISVRKGHNDVTVDAGDGADTITLKGGSGLVDLKYHKFSDTIIEKIYGILSANINADGTAKVHGSTAVIKGGADDDQLNLDTSFELGTLGKTDVDYQGGDGKDRLHLTGTLDQDQNDKRIEGTLGTNGSGHIDMYSKNTVTRTDYSIVDKDLWFNKTVTELVLKSPNVLHVGMTSVDTLTDDLSGKKTVNVTFENGKVMTKDENGNAAEVVFAAFTDYVYAPKSDIVTLASFANTSASTIAGLLTKVIIKGQDVIVPEGVAISVPGAILMLESTNGAHENGSILVKGTLEADTIMLKVVSTDSNEITIFGVEQLGMDPSIMDVNTTATVTIASTAQLIATRLVDILANTIQNHGLLPDLTDLFPGLDYAANSDKINEYVKKAFGFETLKMLKEAASINFVSIKMASAMVNILGSVVGGSVKVSATNKVDTTASNAVLRDIGLPLALSVILSEAGITVSKDADNKTAGYNGANITATLGDVYLDAQSDVKVNTSALSGRLPFTVAVSVVDNKAYVDVNGGSLISTNGNVITNATGVVNLKTSATGSNVRPNNNAVVPSTDNQASNTTTQLEMGKSGGFFAISVLTQDVFAALKGSASASAAGDITINSTAKASVVNNATSNPGEDGESMTLAKMILTLTGDEKNSGDGGIVGKVINKVKNFFGAKETGATSDEEKAEAKKQKDKKTSALGGLVKKLTGEGNKDGDDVGSLVDKATTSANTGKTDSTKSVQMVGALGVTYASNTNKAYVDTTGTVNATGKLSVLANGEMKVETLADGSPVKADDPAAGDDKKEDGPQDQHYAAHSHGIVKVDALTNGTILIGASVGKDNNSGIVEVQINDPKFKVEDPTRFNFVVKACLGYKLEADKDGKYWITNEYHRDSTNSEETEKIEVTFIGKDADGCNIYRGSDVQLFNGTNVFKAEFVPKKSITVENNATHMGNVTVSYTQKDGKGIHAADWEEVVYVTVNVKSGITFQAPVITYISDTVANAQPYDHLQMIDKDGNIITELTGDVQEDGTTNYYYKFEMPNGKVTMNVAFAGEDMKIGVDSAVPADAKVWFGEPTGEAMTSYQGKVGDKIKIVIQLAEGAYLTKNSLMFGGKTPVYIKDITDNGNGQYTCFVNIPAILKTENDSAAAKELKLTFKTTTDTKKAQGTVENTSTSLGAGLVVDVTRYDNQAYINNGTGNQITAGSIAVNANTAALSASAVSKAGYVAGNLGVAGAITVHLVSANNEAYVGGTVNINNTTGGDLTVDSAIQTSNIVTNAQAAGDGADGENTKPDSVGVGAGIAVGVTNLAIVSRILKDAVIAGNIKDLNVNSNHTGSESMTATAGAAGGTSVVPVLGLNISGVSVLAEALSGAKFELVGNALINAANSITRTITADAAAVGSGVGVGGSFIIDILSDSAKAKLNRSAQTRGDLKVTANSVSRLNATAKAGAKGNVSENEGGDAGSGDKPGTPGEEPPPSGESDKKEELPDDYYDGLDSLFGENNAESEDKGGDTKAGDSTSNTEEEEEDDPESLAPLFREGDADKFVDSNKESAKGLSALVENDNGNVKSEDVGKAFEDRQKAETSEGSVQVAATMVLNIQNNEALAQIAAEQKAPVDSIVAGGSVAVTSRHDTDGIIMANASATNSTTGVGVAVAINTVTYNNIAEILAKQITAANLTVRADIEESKAKETAENFLNTLKENVLLAYNMATLIKALLSASNENATEVTLRDFIVNYFNDKGIEVESDSETKNDDSETQTVAGETETENQTGKVGSDVLDAISSLICQWVGELLEGQTPSYPEETKNNQENTNDETADSSGTTGTISETTGENTGSSDGSEADQKVTIENLSSEKLNLAVQYAKDIFNKLKQEFTEENLRAMISKVSDNTTSDTNTPVVRTFDAKTRDANASNDKKPGLFDKIKEKIKDINLKEMAMNALVSYLAGKLGGNEEAEGVGPKISTSAVSGAGAANVGVAGSVAISVVNGTSNAYIGDYNGNEDKGNITVTDGVITVESKASQDVYTSAGASVDALGRVDKNKADTDTANSTQGEASTADTTKSVGVGAAVAMSFADLTSEAGIGSGWTITAKDLLMDSVAENNVETTSVSGTDPLARTEDPTDKPTDKPANKDDEKLTDEQKKEKEEAAKKEEAEKKAAKAMDYAVDASVSVTLIQNVVKSYLAENSVITLGGKLNMLSSQYGETNTNASGYAMGNATAVGAAVAINLAFSDVATQLLGSGTVAGSASLDSKTENQDDAIAMALAMGADMDRYFAKIRNAEKVKDYNKKKEEEKKEEGKKEENNKEDGKDAAEGETEGEGTKENDGAKTLKNDSAKKDGKIENQTGNKISSQLKRASHVSDKAAEDKSDPSQPLSVQAIKSQNVKTESTNQTDSNKNGSVGDVVTDATNSTTGDAVSGTMNDQAQQSQSIHVAASVGVNVTEHSAKTEIKGNLTVGSLKADVENTSNFTTASTGAAIAEATNSNSVGAAVAVSVNGNKALIEIPDGIKIVVTGTPASPEDDDTDTPETEVDSVLGNVALKTVLNQNSTGDALRRYGALSIAGSSSGKGGKVGLAGSIAVMVAKGTSNILLGNNVSITGPSNDDGSTPVAGSVTIEAADKTKLSAAAMAATKSGGVTAGVGASFALLYAENEVKAQAGDNFSVSAADFSMTATKQAITIRDFIEDADIKDYLTVLKVNDKGEGGYNKDNAADYGMFVIQKNQNGTYSYFTNLEAADITSLIQLTSVLASVNYYASAVAGTVMERKGDTSNQKAAVAGAVSMLFNNSVTGVSIGDNANINTSGDVVITASSDANTRLLGGALSSSGAKAGIGLNVATAVQNEQVYAIIGLLPAINADNFTLKAHSKSEIQAITAAAVNASGTSVGGALNVVINNNSAKVTIKSDETHAAKITCVNDVNISADVIADVILGSVTVSISGSTDKGASVGAIVSVTTNASAAEVLVGDYVTIISDSGAINISATNEEMVISVLAAVARSGDGGAGAGTLSVLTTDAKAIARVGNNAILTADKDIAVSAVSKAKLIDVMLAAAASTDAPAVGATIMVNVFNRATGAEIGDHAVILSKHGNVLVTADSTETAVIISVAGAAASQNAISGNIQVNVGSSKTYAVIGDNANVKAWDSIRVTANQDSTVFAISPSFTYGSGSTAVGATVQTNILGSEVKALIGEKANLVAYAQVPATNNAQSTNRENKRKGVILSAMSNDLVVAGGVSASAGKNAVSGVVETLVNKTIVIAKLGSNAVVKSGYATGDAVDAAFSDSTPSEQEGELSAEADSHSTLVLFGGAFSATSSTGVGATVLTLVYDKNVDAQILLSKEHASHVHGNVNVTAKAEDIVALVSVNFGVSNDTAANVGGNVLIFQDKVNAELAGNLSAFGNVTVQADSSVKMINAVASVSGSLGGAAVSGAALVTYFQGITSASVGAGSHISCADLSVLAESTVNINSDGVGITASLGSAAVSGLVNIVVTSTETKAFIGYGSEVNAEKVDVVATDNYTLLAIAASVAGGSNAIGVTAVVTVAKNTVLAYIADNTTVECAALNLQAVSNRDIRNYAGSVGVGSSSGVIVNVMVAVIGGKLDQDSAKGIAKSFEADEFLSGFKSSVPNAAKAYLDDVNLSKDLAADTSKASDLQLGDENGNYSGTDGYRNDDFDKNYTPGTNPGENFSQDVSNTQGSELGMAKPTGDYKNVVKAYIGSGSKITVTGATVVEANEKLNVDIVTASAAVAGTAGVNLGVAVVVAYSNVQAEIESGAIVNCGDLTVHAISGGDGTISHDKASEILNAAGINADASGSSIRVIAVTVGVGGTAGVSPSVAVLNMASNVVARMDGVSGTGKVITVKAETVYPKVLAVTGAVGIGGTAGITASVAVVTFNSDTYAGIVNSGSITADELIVLSNVNNTAKAYAMSLAGGSVGVNGGVAVVTNRSNTNTVLGTGIYRSYSAVTVASTVDTNAESYIVGISLGGIAVGLNGAVVNQHAVINTQILGDTASSLTATGSISVTNNVTATAKSTVVAVVGGGIGGGGNILLVFNNMESTASITGMPFNSMVGYVTVNAGLKADSEANLASATIGGVAVGLSTSYVGLNAKNLAYVEIPEGAAGSADTIRVWAGYEQNPDSMYGTDKPNSFHATATTVAGGIAGVSVGLNAAVADINASNEAKLLVKGTFSGKVDVQAKAAAEALAEIYFASFGMTTVSAATAVSLLRIRQTAEADIATLTNCGAFSVSALMNTGTDVVPSFAKLVTISGGLYNASANVAVAYSLSQNIAKAILHSDSGIGNGIVVKANGNADAKSQTVNETVSAFSGSVYVNVAYAKGQFQSVLKVLGNVSANYAIIESIYTTNAEAKLTPSASGLDLSIAKFNVNLAIAKAAATALAALEGGGKLTVRNDLTVQANGSNSKSLAEIQGAAVSGSLISIAVNVADSQMAVDQTVRVDHITAESSHGRIYIYSYVDNLHSTAQTGANGVKGAGVSIVGGKVNSAAADVNVVNQIILKYANLSALYTGTACEIVIEASGNGLQVNAIAGAMGTQLSGFNAAVTTTEAKVTKFNTGIFLDNSNLSGYRVTVVSSALGTSGNPFQVNAQSSVPQFSGSLISAEAILATAKILQKMTQIIVNSGTITTTTSNVFIRSQADANLTAGTGNKNQTTSVGILSVKDYQFIVDVGNILTEVQCDSIITAHTHAYVQADDKITANITMNDKSIGAFTGTSSIANINVKNQTAYVNVTGEITAALSVLIEALADQNLVANVDTNSKSFAGKGYVQTDVVVYRNAKVDIDGIIVSKRGHITINAKAGSWDENSKIIDLNLGMYLNTWVDNASYPTGTGKVVSVVEVNVAEGSLIQGQYIFDDEGDVTIQALSEGHVHVRVYRYVDKLVGGNRAYSIADVNETVKTNIGGGEKTRILGREVQILAQSYLDVYSFSHTYSDVWAGSFSPNATIIFRVDLDTVIRAADITGTRLLKIGAYLPYASVWGHCLAERTLGASANYPSVTIKGNIYGDVTFDNNTILRADKLHVKSFIPADADDGVKIVRQAVDRRKSDKMDEDTTFYTKSTEALTNFRTAGWDEFSKKVKFLSGVYNPNIVNENNVYYSGKVIWSDASVTGVTTPSGKTEIYLGSGAIGTYVFLDGKVQVKGADESLVTKETGMVNGISGTIYKVDGSKLQNRVFEGTYRIQFDTTNRDYLMDTKATSGSVTVINNTYNSLVYLINMNAPASQPDAYLNVYQLREGDLILDNSGNYEAGSIFVTMYGGNLKLTNGSQINAQNIFINGVGSILDESSTDNTVIITNSSSTGNDADASIDIAVKDALNLILQTSNSSYTIDRIQSDGDLTLEVMNTVGKQTSVILGELISGENAAITVPYSVESADPTKTNITGNAITLNAGGNVGTSSKYLRIDSSVNQPGGVTVTANGGIYLKEANGDLTIAKIHNEGSGNIVLWTENGSIHEDPNAAYSDVMENLNNTMLNYAEQGVILSNAQDMIDILVQYMRDLLRIREALETEGEAVLNTVKYEIDVLHYVTSVEEALEIIADCLEAVGGTNYQDPDVVDDLMHGAVADNSLTEEFNKTVDTFDPSIAGNPELAGLLGEHIIIWRNSFKLAKQYLEDVVKYSVLLATQESVIIGDGDLLLHLQSADGTASVSEEKNSLTVSVGGKITITTDPETVLKDVYLESKKKLTLDPIVATHRIDLYSLNGIYAAKNNRVLLDADEILLWSLIEGDLGTASQALILNTDLLSAYGNSVYLENRKDLIVDIVLALKDMYLTVQGDLNDQQGDDAIINGIHGNVVNLQVSGDIGKAGESVTIGSEGRLNVNAQNLYMSAPGDVLVGIIHTDGMVSIDAYNGTIQKADLNCGIWCKTLTLNAYGMIGTDVNPLLVYSNGVYTSSGGGIMRSLFGRSTPARDTLTANSVLYGENIHIIPTTVQTDNSTDFYQTTVTAGNTGTMITGRIEKGAVLAVSDTSDHEACFVCQHLMQNNGISGRIFMNLKLNGNYAGKLLVQIPATEELAEYEGREIVILLCRNGVVWAVRATVTDGFITFLTEELGSFLIMGDTDQLKLTEDGTQIILDQQVLPFGGWL